MADRKKGYDEIIVLSFPGQAFAAEAEFTGSCVEKRAEGWHLLGRVGTAELTISRQDATTLRVTITGDLSKDLRGDVLRFDVVRLGGTPQHLAILDVPYIDPPTLRGDL